MEGKSPASWLRAARSGAAAINPQAEFETPSRICVRKSFFICFLILRQEAFLTSFLLAHCGGGQDKPGCLGPSAKLPRHFFSFSSLVTSFKPSFFPFLPSLLSDHSSRAL
jgi:hypothetical protein